MPYVPVGQASIGIPFRYPSDSCEPLGPMEESKRVPDWKMLVRMAIFGPLD